MEKFIAIILIFCAIACATGGARSHTIFSKIHSVDIFDGFLWVTDTKDHMVYKLIVNDGQQTAKNPRLQIFDQAGKLPEVWEKLSIVRPTGAGHRPGRHLYVGDTEGKAIWVLKDGKVLERIGDLHARPHNTAWDSGSNELYFADTTEPGQIKKVVKKK